MYLNVPYFILHVSFACVGVLCETLGFSDMQLIMAPQWEIKGDQELPIVTSKLFFLLLRNMKVRVRNPIYMSSYANINNY